MARLSKGNGMPRLSNYREKKAGFYFETAEN